VRLSASGWLNLAAKATLAGLIVLYLLRPDLDQFTGKVMPLRATLFPLAAALVAILWLARGRPRPFPHLPDALITLATIVDFCGNAADLYDRLEWFDHSVLRTGLRMTLRRPGAIGECETRTQGAFVAGGYGRDRGRRIAPPSAVGRHKASF
jgi:hypothetical protein